VDLAVIPRGWRNLLKGYSDSEAGYLRYPAVVNAIEDKTNRKLLRLIADIKESLLQPFNIAIKRLACDMSANIAPFAELCSISKCRIFSVLRQMSYWNSDRIL